MVWRDGCLEPLAAQICPLLEQSHHHPAWLLLLEALNKLLMLGLCLSNCWRSGIFFPVFVVACSTGTALHQWMPKLGSLGSWCGAITGAMLGVLLPSPLLLLGLALLQQWGRWPPGGIGLRPVVQTAAEDGWWPSTSP